MSDEHNLDQFKALISSLTDKGFEHYEISNFAIDGQISRHNSAYWLGNKYLGVGPSAHSFDGKTRQWNVANNTKYIQNLTNNIAHFESEVLTLQDQFNEYLLTRLRTKWGLEKDFLDVHFPLYKKALDLKIQSHLKSGHISETDSHYHITKKGKFIVDHITSELFVI